MVIFIKYGLHKTMFLHDLTTAADWEDNLLSSTSKLTCNAYGLRRAFIMPV